MKHILEFFHEVIPIVFVVGMIAVAFIFYNHIRNLANAGLEKTSTFDEQLENADVLVYDGMKVSGADVVRFAFDFYQAAGTLNAFEIMVSDYNGGKAITNADISTGIRAGASYRCVVKRENGTVKSATFTKQ